MIPEPKPLLPPAPVTSPLRRMLGQYWNDEESRRHFVGKLFDRTAADYDATERLLGMGSGPWYRRGALRQAGLVPGMRVLDIATGTGLVAREALEIVGPEGSVIGLDPSAGMLEQAGRLPIARIRAVGEQLPCRDASFDFVSMGFALRHVRDLNPLLREIHRVLRPGGIACILEITRPRSRVSAAMLETFMTRIVPALAGGANRRASARQLMEFYWGTIDACVSPEAVLQALTDAGFPAPRRTVSLGLFSEYVAAKFPSHMAGEPANQTIPGRP